ncbi:penicillin-binding protein 1A [Erythrobacter sp. HL-111]|uniref:penicillin-binding protein 1A n=1 Tax=Erythrobacter sp. HL-111 TaxID=1798193 RepID=UPI0006DB6202|nr:transglycosylase domain-containing protein [Erythrobacter sp. HL-111]KPP96600.1 MAG: penicillin-binding protein 1A McrA [Erythrobacteraceae bacterium HL-111]SDS01878.1 penicillin-binding protein 1A [Erythrobacter sp. HL-111]
MTDPATLPFVDYVRYRLNRDLGGLAAWFAAKWRESWLFKLAAAAFALLAALWVAAWLSLASDLPNADRLLEYETPLPTVVRGFDGEIVHSYARERRVQLQYPDFPERLKQAYISAEDKTFYSHGGVDFTGTLNAAFDYVAKMGSGERAVGGSTITQQVAKNLLLGDEYSVTRKLKEMILASRIEDAMSKQEILELYLNEIPLGRRSFGVQAAARAYFDKDVADLDLHEMAFLAILPKAPERYGRKGQEQAAIGRRNFVLGQMEANGFITEAERAEAAAEPLGLVTQRRERSVDAGYFLEEVRRQLIARFGETAEDGPNSVYAGGLWVRTSLDPEMQDAARAALREGLLRYHGNRGWSGAIATIDVSEGTWARQLQSSPLGIRYRDWRLGVVTSRDGASARIGFSDGIEAPLTGLPDALKTGDVIVARPAGNGYAVATVPEAQGGIVVQDAQYGRVLAMQGGFDFRLSDFNRATQANRQPGSTIKPFVYAAGLDNGMTPSTRIDNTRYCYYQGANLGEKCIRGGRAGQFPMRYGLEQSQNIMTVQIGSTVGFDNVVRAIEQVGITDEAQPYPSTALGAGETTVARMVAAYAALANHGRLNQPTVIDYVQDRRGKVIWRADERPCRGCNMAEWDGQPMPRFGLKGEQAMDPRTAFQVMHMLEGVVQRGTATNLRDLGLPLFGKTGTTSGPKDVWFVGGTQQLVAGAYVGFDTPRNMGGYAYGGTIAAPIVKSLIERTRPRWSDLPSVAPEGVRMVRVDRRTGKRVFEGWPSDDPLSGIIWEAFKPDTEPERYTRQDAIAARRDEILDLIRTGRLGAVPRRQENPFGQPSDFVEEQGGIY